MSRKYKSRRSYIVARKRKEYNRYVRSYKLREKKLNNKGLEMHIEMYDYNTYFSVKSKVSLVSKNAQRDILQMQTYKFSYSQSVELRKHFEEIEDLSTKEEYQKMSLAEIRSGKGYNLEFLKPIWEKYKKDYGADKFGTYKEAFKKFEQEIFGYAS